MESSSISLSEPKYAIKMQDLHIFKGLGAKLELGEKLGSPDEQGKKLGYLQLYTPGSRPCPRSCPNLSRCAKEGAEKASNDPFNPHLKSDVTEQVSDIKALNASTNNNAIDEEAVKALEDHALDISPLSHHLPHQFPAEQAACARAIGHDQPVDLLQQCQPPPPTPSKGEERGNGIKTEETKQTFTIENFSDMKEIMEDLRNFIRESVRDAFKPL